MITSMNCFGPIFQLDVAQSSVRLKNISCVRDNKKRKTIPTCDVPSHQLAIYFKKLIWPTSKFAVTLKDELALCKRIVLAKLPNLESNKNTLNLVTKEFHSRQWKNLRPLLNNQCSAATTSLEAKCFNCVREKKAAVLPPLDDIVAVAHCTLDSDDESK